MTTEIVDAGWFMTTLRGVLVVYMGAHIDDASYDRYVAATCKEIDSAPTSSRRGILYDVPQPMSSSASRRKQIADILAERRDKLKLITNGYVLVTPSPLVRGMLTAVFWVAPPPYEWKVAATESEAFRWLAGRDPQLDADAALREYLAYRGNALARMQR